MNPIPAARITILRGPGEITGRHPFVATPASEGWAFQIRSDRHFSVPWEGARRLFALLRKELGDTRVEAALAPCRSLLSLVFGELDSTLTGEEARQRDRHSAFCLASMPLVDLSPRPLAEAFAEVMSRLFEGQRAAVIFPEVTSLDRETLLVVRPLLRRTSTRSDLRFVFGYDPELAPKEGLKRQTFDPILYELALLEGLEGTEVHTFIDPVLDELAAERSGRLNVQREIIDRLDDDLERDAWLALQSPEPSAPLVDLGMRGMRRAFACFGFAEVLELAALLEDCTIDPVQAAELHYLAGVAAAHAGRSLAPLAQTKLKAALEASFTPLERANCLYHLVTLTKDKNVANALLNATRSRQIPSSKNLHFEIAARHARAISSSREDRPLEAMSEGQTALDLLALRKSYLDVSDVELALISWNLLSSEIRFSFETGDIEFAAHCEGMRKECEESLPATRRPAIDWLPVQFFDSDLESSAARCLERSREAHHALQPDAEAFWSYLGGELFYRMGEAELALENFRNALQLWRNMHHDDEEVLAAELCCAVAALRANRPEEAEALFASLNSHPLLALLPGQAETLGALAMAAARRGDVERALQRLSAAYKNAEDCTEPDVLVSVHRSAGEMYRMLGYADESRLAFEQALETAVRADASHASGEISPSGLFSLLVNAPADPARIIDALLLLPQALDDGNAWWDLPRLIPGVTRLAERGQLCSQSRPNELAYAVRRLVEAGSQRPDCREAIMELVLSVIERSAYGLTAQ